MSRDVRASSLRAAGFAAALGALMFTPAVAQDAGPGVFPNGVSKELTRRAEAGDVEAQFELAAQMASLVYRSYDKDLERLAAEWMLRAAEAGHPYAQNEMGNFIEKGEFGFEPDPAAALVWFERSAEGGDPNAYFNMAELYRDGRGTARDDGKATRYFEQALAMYEAAGEPNNANNVRCELIERLEHGLGTRPDAKRAARMRMTVEETGGRCDETSSIASLAFPRRIDNL